MGSLRINSSQVQANLGQYRNRVLQRAAVGMTVLAASTETTAKQNAPWHDRTGNARQSITGSTDLRNGASLIAALAIGMSYGIYLEKANGGRYAVVMNTVNGARTQLKNVAQMALTSE